MLHEILYENLINSPNDWGTLLTPSSFRHLELVPPQSIIIGDIEFLLIYCCQIVMHKKIDCVFCLWIVWKLLYYTDMSWSIISLSIKWALLSMGYNLCLDRMVKLLNHFILNCVWKPIIYWTHSLTDGDLMCIEALVDTIHHHGSCHLWKRFTCNPEKYLSLL